MTSCHDDWFAIIVGLDVYGAKFGMCRVFIVSILWLVGCVGLRVWRSCRCRRVDKDRIPAAAPAMGKDTVGLGHAGHQHSVACCTAPAICRNATTHEGG